MRPTKTKFILVLLILFCSMLLFAGFSKGIPPIPEEDINTVTTEDLISERDEAESRIEYLKREYNKKEQELQDIHKEADELREHIAMLNEAIY
jgi:Skp family chaperone for outer membrane proteins